MHSILSTSPIYKTRPIAIPSLGVERHFNDLKLNNNQRELEDINMRIFIGYKRILDAHSQYAFTQKCYHATHQTARVFLDLLVSHFLVPISCPHIAEKVLTCTASTRCSTLQQQ